MGGSPYAEAIGPLFSALYPSMANPAVAEARRPGGASSTLLGENSASSIWYADSRLCAPFEESPRPELVLILLVLAAWHCASDLFHQNLVKEGIYSAGGAASPARLR